MEKLWQALWWRKTRGVKCSFHCKCPHRESCIQFYLQVLHWEKKKLNVSPAWCSFILYVFCSVFCNNFVWYHLVGKSFTSCWKLRCRIFERQWALSRPLHTHTRITRPLHNLVLKSPSSIIILYTYTKLKTPVFSVKWCYAYLYCMYVYPFFCSWTVLLYLPQSQM